MFSQIVVGTDGSETAKTAVAMATGLARNDEAMLHIVTGYREPARAMSAGHGGVLAADTGATSSAVAKSGAQLIVDDAAAEIEGVGVQTHALAAAPADAICSVAESLGADLIVVGSKGMRGAHRLIGSVPNSVAHGAPCHVLIVKTK